MSEAFEEVLRFAMEEVGCEIVIVSPVGEIHVQIYRSDLRAAK